MISHGGNENENAIESENPFESEGAWPFAKKAHGGICKIYGIAMFSSRPQETMTLYIYTNDVLRIY